MNDLFRRIRVHMPPGLVPSNMLEDHISMHSCSGQQGYLTA